MILDDIKKTNAIHPPQWLIPNTMYLTRMGSEAYGVSTDNSDIDIYGFCIPPRDMVFPHLAGEISGFGKQIKRFEQWTEHHCQYNGCEYDFSVYGIVKYFNLVSHNNPNMIDSIFVPENCIVHQTQISQLVRENRKSFVHKGCWHTFKGYAYQMMHKLKTKNPQGKRKELIEKYKYDVKYAYHLVRLLNEVEQLLTEGDLDLQRNNEQLKSIRRGEWTEQEIENYFTEKEKTLEKVYSESKLPWGIDEDKLKNLLLQCLEIHYGKLDNCIQIVDPAIKALQEIAEIVNIALKR